MQQEKYKVSVASHLVADYLLSQDVTPNTQVHRPLATYVQSNGVAGALAIIKDQGLCSVTPTPAGLVANHSAYLVKPIPLPGAKDATEVVSSLCPQTGVVHAFYCDGKSTYHTTMNIGKIWATPTMFPRCSHLGVVVTSAGQLVGYGVLEGAKGTLLLMVEKTKGHWVHEHVAGLGSLDNALLVCLADGSFCVVSRKSGTIHTSTFSLPRPNVKTTNLHTPKPVANLLSIWAVPGALYSAAKDEAVIIWSDATGNLHTTLLVARTTATAATNTNTVSGTHVTHADTGFISFYFLNSLHILSALNQTGWQDDGHPTWDFPVPLLPSVLSLAAPITPQGISPPTPTPPSTPTTTFPKGVPISGSVEDQSTNGGVTRRVSSAGRKLRTVAPQAVDLFLIGQKDKQQVGKQQVGKQQSDKAPLNEKTSTLWSLCKDAVAVGQSASVWTKQSVRQQATIPQPFTSYRVDVVVSLALEEELGAGLVASPPVNGLAMNITSSRTTTMFVNDVCYLTTPDSALTFVTNTTGKLSFTVLADNGLVAPEFYISVFGVEKPVVVKPNLLYLAYLESKSSIYTGSVVLAPLNSEVVLNASVGNTPLFPNAKNAAFAQACVAVLNQVAPVALSPFQNGLSAQKLRSSTPTGLDYYSCVEDLFLGFSTGVIKQKSFTFHGTSIQTTFSTSEGQKEVELDVNSLTAQQIVHLMFGLLGADSQRISEWVQDNYDWKGMWNTKIVIELLMQQTFVGIAYYMKRQGTITGDYFTDIKGKVAGAFDLAIQKYGSEKFKNLEAKPSTKAGESKKLAPLDDLVNDPQMSYFFQKVKENAVTTSFPKSSCTSAEFHPLFEEITNTELQEMFFAAIAPLHNILEDFDPANLPNQTVGELLEGLKPAVLSILDLADSVVPMMLNLMQIIFVPLMNHLMMPCNNLPIISWMFQNVITKSGTSASVVGLGTMMLAIPITVRSVMDADGFASGKLEAPFPRPDVLNIASWRFTSPNSVAKQGFVGKDNFIEKLGPLRAMLGQMYSQYDAMVDQSSPTDKSTLAALSIMHPLLGFLINTLNWPGDNFLTMWPECSSAKELTIISWLLGFFPSLLNMTRFLAVPGEFPSPFIQYVENFGKVFLSINGAIVAALGIAGAVMGTESTPTIANQNNLGEAILRPLTLYSQFMRLDSNNLEPPRPTFLRPFVESDPTKMSDASRKVVLSTLSTLMATKFSLSKM